MEAENSFIKYLQESIIEPGQENNADLIRKLNKYKEKVITSIKQDKIISFHKDLRFWCAYHKVGEFTPKNLKKGSPDYKELERVKKGIYSCFKDELGFEPITDLEKLLWTKSIWKARFTKNSYGEFVQDDKGEFMMTSERFKEKEFQVIRDKMARVYQALEYLKSEGMEFNEQQHNEVVGDLGRAVIEKIKPEKMKDFQMWFRKFRYLSQEGDFNRENILNSRFYNQMYGYTLQQWNDSRNGSALGNLARDAAVIAGTTFVVEMMIVGIVLTGVSAVETMSAEYNAAQQSCQLGDPTGCNKIIRLDNLLDYNREFQDAMTRQMMSGFI